LALLGLDDIATELRRTFRSASSNYLKTAE
jgi:hypothetical protein